MSNKRKSAKTPMLDGHRIKKNSTPGQRCCGHQEAAIQPVKQSGMATISSNTTEPGSFFLRICSASPHSQTERPTARRLPAINTGHDRPQSSSASQPKPTTEPKVPGAIGMRPAPKPWAIHSFINPPGKECDYARDR